MSVVVVADMVDAVDAGVVMAVGCEVVDVDVGVSGVAVRVDGAGGVGDVGAATRVWCCDCLVLI